MGEEQDALDILIVGIMEGTISTEGASDSGGSGSDSEADVSPPSLIDSTTRQAGNPNPAADYYKCGQNHDGSWKKGPNEWLAIEFDKLHHLYEGQRGKNEFSIRGYQRGESTPASRG